MNTNKSIDNMKKEDILYIIIPAYNEQDNIKNVINDWYPIIEKYNGNGKSRLVILNDGSKDNTSKIAREQTNSKNLLEIIDKENSGHGATVLYGYNYAISKNTDYIFQTDSDGQTIPSEFEQFWNIRKKYDMIIGNRNKREDGISRIFITKVLKLVIKLSFGVTVTDANTPFRLMSKKSLEDCKSVIPKDFNLSNVILSIAYIKKGYNVKYIPITFRPRQGGENSINVKKIFGIGKKALKDFCVINKKFNEAEKEK